MAVAAGLTGAAALSDVVIIGGVYREVLDGDTSPRPRLGGSGLTAALLASLFGVSISLVSFVGEEDAPATLALLDAAGVERGSVLVLPGASGTFVFPTEGDVMSRPWPMYRPAEAAPDTPQVIPHGTVYALFGMPDLDPIAAGWVDNLPKEGVLLWDRQGWISRARDSHAVGFLPPETKVYIANLEEAQEEFPAPTANESLANLPPPGFAAAIVKQGPRGCIVIDSTRGTRIETNLKGFKVTTSSTVGSGDAFAGAFAARMALGDQIVLAAKLANAAAAAFLEGGGNLFSASLKDRAYALVEENGSDAPSNGRHARP
jgi:ribokinase